MSNSTPISKSRFWQPLWERYKNSPSIALCRVPELELASHLPIEGARVLDHCCGNGLFAGLAWPTAKFAAGCDLSASEVSAASKSGRYERTDVVDVSNRLPYADQSFEIVFNNSALEHIWEIDRTLSEINRVLVPGGSLAFNVLNDRYFDWWVLDDESKKAYQKWQPFHHAWSLEQWKKALEKHGLFVKEVHQYFDRPSAELLGECDYAFSAAYFKKTESTWTKAFRRGWGLTYWNYVSKIKSATWQSDHGAGFFIVAEKTTHLQ